MRSDLKELVLPLGDLSRKQAARYMPDSVVLIEAYYATSKAGAVEETE